jgi:hypothetical protein
MRVLLLRLLVFPDALLFGSANDFATFITVSCCVASEELYVLLYRTFVIFALCVR